MREPLQNLLGLNSAEVQIGTIMTGVMLLMGAATFVFAESLTDSLLAMRCGLLALPASTP